MPYSPPASGVLTPHSSPTAHASDPVDWLDRRERYFVFMVALNWSNLVQVGILLLVYSPAAAMLLPAQLLRPVGAAAVAYILVYEWYIAKVGLNISGGKAVAIVLLDSFIGAAIFAMRSRLS